MWPFAKRGFVRRYVRVATRNRKTSHCQCKTVCYYTMSSDFFYKHIYVLSALKASVEYRANGLITSNKYLTEGLVNIELSLILIVVILIITSTVSVPSIKFLFMLYNM